MKYFQRINFKSEIFLAVSEWQTGQENCLFAQLILMIISSEEITTGQEYNEYLGEFQMENYNLEDNQSVRSNLSLIQVAPTPTFATGN